MPLHEAAHHLRLARGAERRTGFLRPFDFDEFSDDLSALDQQRVDRLIDAIDLGAQFGERRRRAQLWLCFA
jgi:hypothetical protein